MLGCMAGIIHTLSNVSRVVWLAHESSYVPVRGYFASWYHADSFVALAAPPQFAEEGAVSLYCVSTQPSTTYQCMELRTIHHLLQIR